MGPSARTEVNHRSAFSFFNSFSSASTTAATRASTASTVLRFVCLPVCCSWSRVLSCHRAVVRKLRHHPDSLARGDRRPDHFVTVTAQGTQSTIAGGFHQGRGTRLLLQILFETNWGCVQALCTYCIHRTTNNFQLKLTYALFNVPIHWHDPRPTWTWFPHECS